MKQYMEDNALKVKTIFETGVIHLPVPNMQPELQWNG